ncbi:hypothetical protein JK203_10925 [Gluconobacter cerinus]|uniref:Uncharacterized protein n=1 Tax=Gluconobacter cerinus TaxID=38307 RepID=A0A1B6VNH1_9PROT|nr:MULTISPECIES: hypothetical protein [Gluconobacter]MBS1018678.1 hypothetical protein [Gluconobacter cerinus]MBS1024954.1 hypothetical protein [Gluconobacter cerinus]MBS1030822.1 hypothetical protein [Gluconobacter cerinus]MBS1037076.1 hypothetical protein [Gluconobacter cerinus]MBS1041352.1 hypothetical protein [Gluconobacter cerinus]
MQDDQQVSEDKLREALARLGSGSSRPQKARPITPTTERRRRFVRDGQVVVEHQASRGFAQRSNAPSQDDQDEIERLRQSVKREQRRWEEAERYLAEARTQLKTYETREAHAKIQITELNRHLREHQDQIQSLKAQLHQSREQAAEAARRSPRPVGRPRKEVQDETVVKKVEKAAVEAPAVLLDEPEPVQWWVKA